MKRNWPCVGCTLFVSLGCGNGDDRSPPSANLTPQELCAKRCQLEVNAGCAKTPPDYLSSCTSICLAKYTKNPNCDSSMRSFDACGIDRVSYGCSNDVIQATPTGACATEGAACIGCTGDLMECL